MVYVRTKKSRNKKTGAEYEYYQLVESRWEDGKPRQKVIMHLGTHPSPDALYVALEVEERGLAQEYDELLRQRKNLKSRLTQRVKGLERAEEKGEAPAREQIRELHNLQERLWRLGDEIEKRGCQHEDAVAKREALYPHLSDERRASIDRHREIMRRFGE